MTTLNLYWCRRDFRLHDNPALYHALKDEKCFFLPVFVLEDYMCQAKPSSQFGLNQRKFLAECIPHFTANFQQFLLVPGKAAKTIIEIKNFLEKEGVDTKVFVNEDVYIDFYKQVAKLKKYNVTVEVFPDQLTVNKNLVTGTGNIYSIFTPFKKAAWKEFLTCQVLPEANPKKTHLLDLGIFKKLKKHLSAIETEQKAIAEKMSSKQTFQVQDYKSKHIHQFNIEEILQDKSGFSPPYTSENEALKRFEYFMKNNLVNYAENRDSLENEVQEEGFGSTSKISLALSWGLVSARLLRHEIQKFLDEDFLDLNWFNIPPKYTGATQFLSELLWREFYKYLLFHKPELMNTEFQEKFRFKINWVEENQAVKRFVAWIKGETGYKVVDAAMMQLAKTGLMHNRARMIVASVLTKNLGVDWRWGQEYFRAQLLDLDEASNNGGWQWGASVGADPKPIRIFNPYLQAENYDKKGEYQKKWLGDEKYHFDIPPIVDHKDARSEALKRYNLDKHSPARDY